MLTWYPCTVALQVLYEHTVNVGPLQLRLFCEVSSNLPGRQHQQQRQQLSWHHPPPPPLAAAQTAVSAATETAMTVIKEAIHTTHLSM
jgi:hypothetical protein